MARTGILARKGSPADAGLYESDFYRWTQRQAAELRRAAAQRADLPLDFENLAEEIESLGKSDRRAVVSHLALIVEHLLKLAHSPARQPRAGRRRSVRQARLHLRLVLDDSPSLAVSLPELLEAAYEAGAHEARGGLRRYGEPAVPIPSVCPYSLDQLLDRDWWPEGRAPDE